LKTRLFYLATAGFFVASLAAAPVSAQTGGGNGNGNNNAGPNGANASCTQTTSGAGGTATGGPQTNRSGSAQTLVGVIDALIGLNDTLNNTQLVANALNSSNVQVVCLNDVLNQNDISLLSDVLSGNQVLNNSLNDSLNNLAQNLLQNADVSALNNVQVVTVNLGGSSPQVFLLRR
jgi:hypothetical protein